MDMISSYIFEALDLMDEKEENLSIKEEKTDFKDIKRFLPLDMLTKLRDIQYASLTVHKATNLQEHITNLEKLLDELFDLTNPLNQALSSNSQSILKDLKQQVQKLHYLNTDLPVSQEIGIQIYDLLEQMKENETSQKK